MTNLYTDAHTFDVENRFKSTTAGGVTTLFVYNGEGQRVTKTVSGGSGYTTYYVGEYYELTLRTNCHFERFLREICRENRGFRRCKTSQLRSK